MSLTQIIEERSWPIRARGLLIDARLAYATAKVGFPSEREELLMPYVEDRYRPTETVYAQVPIEVIVEVIDKHGGVA